MRRSPWILLSLLPFALHAKSAEPPASTPALNEIAGRVQSIDVDAQSLRLLTESGYNVTFTYNRETVLKGIGIPKVITDISRDELVTVRYPGKELFAAEIEKRSLAAVH